MIVIGFGSILSWTECVLDSGLTILRKWDFSKFFVNSEKKELMFRLAACLIFFAIGLGTLATQVIIVLIKYHK